MFRPPNAASQECVIILSLGNNFDGLFRFTPHRRERFFSDVTEEYYFKRGGGGGRGGMLITRIPISIALTIRPFY